MSHIGVGLQSMYLLGSLSGGTLPGESGSTLAGVTSGTSQPIKQDGRDVTLYLGSIGTTSGGVVTIEEAGWSKDEHPYSGTWSKIADVNASTFTGTAQIAYHLSSPTPYQYLRVRVSSNITGGGTIYVWMYAE